jgi:(2R)-3-sulfolactate dehydrogenase (NADP+)
LSGLVRLSLAEAFDLAEDACVAAGASPAMARCLAEATVAAEARGQATVGFSHLVDYVDALRDGRIVGSAIPILTSPAPALQACDVQGGIAQLGFAEAHAAFVQHTKSFGISLLAVSNGYTTGELGWYVRRMTDAGLVAVAATNGPALMKPPGARAPVYCTNPIAFGAPGRDGTAVLIDQASSAAAFIAIRRAAERGESIPAGWAVDSEGRDTVDARAAIGGTLLSFGGARGANIALMVEVLAAGLTGSNWSVDAPAFDGGPESPRAGLLVIAIAPALLDPGFAERLDAHTARLSALGVHIPGRRQATLQAESELNGILLPTTVIERLRRR